MSNWIIQNYTTNSMTHNISAIKMGVIVMDNKAHASLSQHSGGRIYMYPIINKRETGVNLRRIMDRQQMTVKDVQQYLELGSIQSIYHWLNGISLPSIDNLYALSELFQLPMDDLICGNRPIIRRRFIGMDENIRRWFSYYDLFWKMYAMKNQA